MTENPRRSGFRLPWGDERERQTAEEPQPGEQREAQPDAIPAGESNGAATPVGGESPSTAEDRHAPANESAEPAEFLRELVGAMRGVAESSREASLAQLRTAVEARVDELRAMATEEAEELRRRSELDLASIGEWERAEIERIRAEAERRREARRAQLEQQLTDHQAASDRDVEETHRKQTQYERDLAAFFAQLAEIDDPATFVAAARRMPLPPDLGGRATARGPNGSSPLPVAEEEGTAREREAPAGPATAEPAPKPDRTLAERLAELDRSLAVPPAAPATEAASPAAPTSAAQPSSNGEASTAIVVRGLGSFGAITSFKQALERVEGIRGVTLSLGPTGEFVYRASHSTDFDLVAAIHSIEGPAAGIERSEGTLQVTIERAR